MNAASTWESRATALLRVTFSGAWDWKVFYQTFTTELEKCGTASQRRVCILIDLRDVTGIPSDAVLHLRVGARMAEVVEGKIIVIAKSITAVTAYRLFVGMYQTAARKFTLAASDEEAYQILGLNA